MTSAQRRQFLRNAALAAAVSPLPRWAWSTSPALQTNPFALGIASGDPVPDGVVLWTRLLLTDPAQMLAAHTVRWEVAHDAGFTQIVQKGEAPRYPRWATACMWSCKACNPHAGTTTASCWATR